MVLVGYFHSIDDHFVRPTTDLPITSPTTHHYISHVDRNPNDPLTSLVPNKATPNFSKVHESDNKENSIVGHISTSTQDKGKGKQMEESSRRNISIGTTKS